MNELKQGVRQALLALGGLAPRNADVAVEPVLNYGGFVNRSFRVAAGDRVYHAKLTADEHQLRGLERWRAVRHRLAEEYRAPTMRGWLEIPGTSFSGPVFDWIDGRRPAAVEGAFREDVAAVVRRLHGDDALAAELMRLDATATSCREAYLSAYHRRFIEDLELLRREPPPFLEDGLVDWLSDEALDLADVVISSVAFTSPAGAPTHRDLWLDNLMVTAERFYILDWDEMGLGDAVMDWAMLFGPSRGRVRPATEAEVSDLRLSAAERERFLVFARASLLDWIIDPLADWVEAAHHAEHGAAVRESNRRVSTEALGRYRELYG